MIQIRADERVFIKELEKARKAVAKLTERIKAARQERAHNTNQRSML